MAVDVRPFQVNDTESLRAICCATAPEQPFLPWLEVPRLACELFLDPYLELESESCFVGLLDGRVVGYIVGTRDERTFRLRQRTRLQHRLIRLLRIHIEGVTERRFTHLFSHRAMAKIYWKALAGLRERTSDPYYDMDRYPATSHIQVVPEARGKSVALALMLQFHKHLKAHGAPGYHGVAVEESGREDFSRMLLALQFRQVHELQFTSRDVRTLVHPGLWKRRVFVREV